MIPAVILAALIAAGAQAGSSAYASNRKKKESKLRSKEMKRETMADALDQSRAASEELQQSGYDSRSRLSRNRVKGLMDSAASLREGFKI